MGVRMQLALLPLVLIAAVSATTFDQCANKKDPIALRVNNCDKPPCNFVQGTNAVMEMDFLVEKDTKSLTPKVKAEAMGLIIDDYPIKEKDACKALTNGECPLDQGEEVTYRLVMDIDPKYPPTDLLVQLSLTDEHGATLACFRLAGRVVQPPQ